jgi:cytochrome c oxidase assembly factor CtaG/putative copper export protein
VSNPTSATSATGPTGPPGVAGGPGRTGSGPRPAYAALAPAVVAAGVAVLVGLLIGHGAQAPLAGLLDPGTAVRWGLPFARTVHDLAAALTIGALVLAAVALPEPARPTALRLAAGAGIAWVGAGVLVLVLTYADFAGVSLGTPGFGAQLASFVQDFDLGRAMVASLLVAFVVATGAAIARSLNAIGWLAALSLLAILPLALAGHAAGSSDHEMAVDSLGAHLVAVTVWVGGLAVLAIMRGSLGKGFPVAAQRFSTLAGWCFAIVAVSGVINAWLRLGGFGGLPTAYGALVMIKVVALLLLGVAGLEQRQRTIARLAADPSSRVLFARLAAGELVVMGVAIGIAVALSRSAPPTPDKPLGDVGPAQALTGYPLPPPLDFAHWFTVWRIDPLWLSLAVLGVGWYLFAVRRLAARGDRWPVLRAVSWVAGAVVLVYATSGGPGVYGRVLFSAHMLEHMTVSMVVPPLLVLGAPVTLALRTSTARRDRTRGWREWLMVVVHSRALRVLGHPLVAAAIFMVSLVAFYFSPLLILAMRTHTGHVLMNLHFLLAGYLFASVLIGVDPGVKRPAYPLRLVLLLVTLSFHAFFGLALMSSTELLAIDHQPSASGPDRSFFQEVGRTWGAAPLADQQNGGAIAWGVGDVPSLLLALGIAVAWSRSDEREAKRKDRAADRDGDAELTAYNADLAARAARSAVASDDERPG